MKIYHGEVPDFIPAAHKYIVEVPFPGDRFFGQELVGDDAWGVNWTAFGHDPRFDGQTPTPGTKVLTDITKWREQVKFPDLEELPVDLILPLILNSQTEDRDNVIVKGLLLSGTWERVNQLMGMEDALCAFYEEPECLKELMEAIADYKIKCIDKLCEILDPDIIHMQDDWGADRSMMMSPDTWREFIKPIEKRYADYIHSKGKIYEHHSCGYIKDIIPDLIEIGVDALNPINASNDCDEVYRLYGDKLVLIGMVDNQKIDFVDCPEEKIREEARRVLDAYSKNGRFIPYFFPTLERTWNILFDEVEKYGASKQ